MNIEESYLALSGFFDLWVRIMEIRTRIMEVQDSRIEKSKILIISPPEERGIKLLTEANSKGESNLLCFSEDLEKKAKEYIIRRSIKGLEICVEPFFSIPFDDNHFDAVFANCFFDFCREGDVNNILKEINRTLKNRGMLFAVYMNAPGSLIERTWVSLFYKFQSLSRGCHPVDIIPFLPKCGFKLKRNSNVGRFGFPVKYIIAEA